MAVSPSPKFDFYEKVRCIGSKPDLAKIAGRLCAVLGRSYSENGGWWYAVHVYGEPIGYCCEEADLEPTGEFDVRESFYDGTSVRVSIHGEIR